MQRHSQGRTLLLLRPNILSLSSWVSLSSGARAIAKQCNAQPSIISCHAAYKVKRSGAWAIILAPGLMWGCGQAGPAHSGDESAFAVTVTVRSVAYSHELQASGYELYFGGTSLAQVWFPTLLGFHALRAVSFVACDGRRGSHTHDWGLPVLRPSKDI